MVTGKIATKRQDEPCEIEVAIVLHVSQRVGRKLLLGCKGTLYSFAQHNTAQMPPLPAH